MSDSGRLTPLAVMILALLREGEMHPYEMMRLLRQRRDERLVRIQNGTVYHTVARLERDGLLVQVGTDRDGNRPERTTYALAPDGERAVAQWVRAHLPRIDRPADFRVALAEAHNLDRAEVIALLDRRRERLVHSAAGHGDGIANAVAGGIPEQFLVEVQREEALLRAELVWQDALRARLADRSLPWGIDEIPVDLRDSLRRERNTVS